MQLQLETNDFFCDGLNAIFCQVVNDHLSIQVQIFSLDISCHVTKYLFFSCPTLRSNSGQGPLFVLEIKCKQVT